MNKRSIAQRTQFLYFFDLQPQKNPSSYVIKNNIYFQYNRDKLYKDLKDTLNFIINL